MTPAQLGAPARYTSWRPGQDRAFDKLVMSRRRFPVLALPTGIGKSLVYMTDAVLNDSRTVALTATRGLQDQLHRDYEEVGLVDVRGMGNYPCLELGGQHMCDVGPCLDGYKCELRQGGCLYFEAERRAREAKLVSSNYAFWLTLSRRGDGLGERDLLVLDEAHEAAEEIGRFMRIEISHHERPPRDGEVYDMDEWREWAEREVAFIGREVAGQVRSAETRRLWRLRSKLERLAETQGEWVPYQERGRWCFEPLWPAPYAETMLFRAIPRVVLSSATIRPKALEYLGLTPDDYEFIQAPNPIPAGRRPVIWVPTVSVKHGNTDDELGQLIDRIDQAIDWRLDRKGIVHGVSYDRSRFIKRASRYGGLMITHGEEGAKEAVAEYLASPPPAVLLSPSVGTGYDFAYEAAEYQIVPKVPFPSRESSMVVARTEQDPDYPKFVALSRLEQMVGRVARAPDDVGETLIFDNNVNWLLWGNKDFTSDGFRQAFRKELVIPAPPPKLT